MPIGKVWGFCLESPFPFKLNSVLLTCLQFASCVLPLVYQVNYQVPGPHFTRYVPHASWILWAKVTVCLRCPLESLPSFVLTSPWSLHGSFLRLRCWEFKQMESLWREGESPFPTGLFCVPSLMLSISLSTYASYSLLLFHLLNTRTQWQNTFALLFLWGSPHTLPPNRVQIVSGWMLKGIWMPDATTVWGKYSRQFRGDRPFPVEVNQKWRCRIQARKLAFVSAYTSLTRNPLLRCNFVLLFQRVLLEAFAGIRSQLWVTVSLFLTICPTLLYFSFLVQLFVTPMPLL